MPITIQGVCPLLQVFDMPTALAFYRDVLGFHVVDAAPAGALGDTFGWVWLRHGARDGTADGGTADGGTDVMLNTAYDPDAARPPAPDLACVAAHDDTALFLGCPDFDAAYHHLRARGLDVAAPAVAPYGMRQLFVYDPDGFGLCLQWPAPAPATDAATATSA